MGSRIKPELIIGIISIVILLSLITARIVNYKNQTTRVSPLLSPIPSIPSTNTNALTSDTVSKHNNPNDCWIIIENKVYDVTSYLTKHPGGEWRITPFCGKDATQPFLTKDGQGSHSAEAFQILGLIYVGDVNGKTVQQPDTKTIQTLPVKEREGDDD